jgi:hypothetical protein
MIDDWLLSLLYAAWLAASTMPLGFMLGSSCSPCCGGCQVDDGKPRTDPVNEGTWTPSGTWRGVGGVTWAFTANPGDDSGETWFFYGSAGTSKVGGGASQSEQRDWFNLCNWYSNKTTSPSTTSGLPGAFDKRATRLPPDNAIIHGYTLINAPAAGVTVKNAYFWSTGGLIQSTGLFSTTSAAHDSAGGAVFNNSSVAAGTVNNGATFNDSSDNASGNIYDGATFNGSSLNRGFVSDGGNFYDMSQTRGTVNDGATFNGSSSNNNGIVNGGATFNGNSVNFQNGATINGGATFNDNSANTFGAGVNGGATFNGNSKNSATVNSGATFNDNSENSANGTVNGGATFNNAACSRRFVG